MTKIALWCEFMPYHWVAGDLPLLHKLGLSLNLAIPSHQIGAKPLHALLREAARLGVEIRAWLLLPDSQGYWPNANNAKSFADTVHRFYDWIEAEKLPLPTLIADLEPALADSLLLKQLLLKRHLPALLKHLHQPERQTRFVQAQSEFNRLIVELHQRGTEAWAVTYPLVVEDALAGNRAFQELLQLPVSGVAWDALSLMTYRSSFRDILGFSVSAQFIEKLFHEARHAFDMPVQAALGVVGTVGKLSEGGYQDPHELGADCQAARRAGVSEIQIFSLDGMHRALTPHDWINALNHEQKPEKATWADQGVRLLFKTAHQVLTQTGPDRPRSPLQIFRRKKELQTALTGTDRNLLKYLRQLIEKDRIRFFRPQR